MLLAGLRWDRLGLRDRLDVAEALMVDGGDVQGLRDRIAEAYPDAESWGRSHAAQQGLAAAETVYGEPAPRLSDEKRAERERRKAERDARRMADSQP